MNKPNDDPPSHIRCFAPWRWTFDDWLEYGWVLLFGVLVLCSVAEVLQKLVD